MFGEVQSKAYVWQSTLYERYSIVLYITVQCLYGTVFADTEQKQLCLVLPHIMENLHIVQ
jgi:hypothetical protein